MTEEEQRLCSDLERRLQSVPVYQPAHQVVAKTHKNGTWVCYKTSESLGSIESTRADLQISGRTCYLLWMCIDADKRRMGYGRKLYETLEIFCRDQECTVIELTPSGNGKEIFWRKMGFQRKSENSDGFIKRLV